MLKQAAQYLPEIPRFLSFFFLLFSLKLTYKFMNKIWTKRVYDLQYKRWYEMWQHRWRWQRIDGRRMVANDSEQWPCDRGDPRQACCLLYNGFGKGHLVARMRQEELDVLQLMLWLHADHSNGSQVSRNWCTSLMALTTANIRHVSLKYVEI